MYLLQPDFDSVEKEQLFNRIFKRGILRQAFDRADDLCFRGCLRHDNFWRADSCGKVLRRPSLAGSEACVALEPGLYRERAFGMAEEAEHGLGRIGFEERGAEGTAVHQARDAAEQADVPPPLPFRPDE